MGKEGNLSIQGPSRRQQSGCPRGQKTTKGRGPGKDSEGKEGTGLDIVADRKLIRGRKGALT